MRHKNGFQMAPIFFDYERTPMGLKKMTISLDVFDTYLQRENSEYAAGSKYHFILQNVIILWNSRKLKLLFIN